MSDDIPSGKKGNNALILGQVWSAIYQLVLRFLDDLKFM